MPSLRPLLALGLAAFLASGSVTAQTPQVTERQEAQRTVREYRLNGQLYAIEVRPAQGERYFLVDRNGDGNFQRQAGNGVEIPAWVQER
ncbi:DUF2782 domain-containing protein [Halomonas pacifica]|uniref:DUF2782 domain-containing protein n=1 Tax=Bisbaumannia pacifica TaxID=77098 RepID=A0A510X8E9_9GAMM|nr:DUF2782 domain-containing protein [Halomonas pacifica]MBH8581469.1 DUF2782 domain-containing protein [Halomonas pacifica]MDC8801852.1 DUF2782 domain-containing protein [Halomonas pacifica]GEK47663.1 hypothetical protein HPA02_19460 [Halomonas pacifica]